MEVVRGTSRVIGLAALVAAEVAAVWMLHRLGELPWLAVGWDDLAVWLAAVPVEDAVMAVLRLAALVGAYWLAVTTAGYTLARMAGLPTAASSVAWATVPAVRRIADRAVAVMLTGSSFAVGAAPLAVAVVPPPAVTAPGALPGDPPVSGVPGPPASGVPGLPPAGVPPAGPPAPAPGDSAPAEPATPPAAGGADLGPAPAEPAPPPAPGTHTVVPGDNLWAITAGVLGARASNAEIHPRWLEMIAANRDRLSSGDPDLIYPGERIVVPPANPGGG